MSRNNNNNNNSSRELAKILKNSGKMSTGTKILLAVGFVVIVVVLLYIIYPDLFTVKKEGEDCEKEGGDSRGIYKINKDKKCVLDSCVTNWEVSGKKCVKVKTPAVVGDGLVDIAPEEPMYTIPKPGFGRNGGDITTLSGELSECKTTCDTTPGCTGIGYNVNTKECFIKDDTTGNYVASDYVYYRKNTPTAPTTTTTPATGSLPISPPYITPGGYYRLPVKDDGSSYIESDAVSGWSVGAVGSDGSLTSCENTCNGTGGCVGFNSINNECHFKNTTVDDAATAGKNVAFGTYQGSPINYYINPNRDSTIGDGRTGATSDSPNVSGYPVAITHDSECKLECLKNAGCQGLTIELTPDGTKNCHLKSTVATSYPSPPDGYEWVYYPRE